MGGLLRLFAITKALAPFKSSDRHCDPGPKRPTVTELMGCADEPEPTAL
jgi:hypothetical protein